MSQYSNDSILNTLTLGKATQYAEHYDASLLQGVPRSMNRQQLNINENQLPFNGEDVWYGYELSWLNSKGKPVVAVAEFRFPCQSKNIVESKSFKLYLNSFNQSRFDSWEIVTQTLTKDLSAIVNSPVTVTLFSVDNCPPLLFNPNEYQTLDDLDITVDSYELSPALLTTVQNNVNVEEKLVSHLLKSNCLITNQPDWASVYIDYQGAAIDHQSLLKYLISFRQHNEFHEQCVERIFSDIMEHCQPTKLTIYARYTRRGGLDINPYRSTEEGNAPNLRTLRQ